MPHEVFVRDVVAVQRKVMLPDHCPRCKVSFELGSKNVKLCFRILIKNMFCLGDAGEQVAARFSSNKTDGDHGF